MVLAIEMGVVFVLLTAILIALYIAWQNAKFVGDRLKKKQVMKRLVAGSAAIILAVVVAISTMVPAFAAETTGGTMTDGNSQIVYEEPDLGESDATDNCITLPDAPTKEGYSFRGWRVNGGSDLYDAGDVVVKDDGEEIHLQPVYERAKSDTATEVKKKDSLIEIAVACLVGALLCTPIAVITKIDAIENQVSFMLIAALVLILVSSLC